MKKVVLLMFLMMFAFSTAAFAHKGTVVYFNAVSKNTVIYFFNNYFCGQLKKVSSGVNNLYEGDELDGHFAGGKREFDDLTNGRKVTIDIKLAYVSKDRAKAWVAENKKDAIW